MGAPSDTSGITFIGVRPGLMLVPITLALASCASHNGQPTTKDINNLCGLTTLPHANQTDRAALVAEADRRIKSLRDFPNTERNRAVAKATTELVATGYRLLVPTGAPTPLASLFMSGSDESVEMAVKNLVKACR